MTEFIMAFPDNVIVLIAFLTFLGSALSGLWGRLKIKQAKNSPGVILKWQPSRELWNDVLKDHLDRNFWFSIILGYIFAIMALIAAAFLVFLNGNTSLAGNHIHSILVNAAGFLLCAGLLWWPLRPKRWHAPCKYIFTEKGVWFIEEGLFCQISYLQWSSVASAISPNSNWVVLSSLRGYNSFDIIYPSDIKDNVEKILRKKLSSAHLGIEKINSSCPDKSR